MTLARAWTRQLLGASGAALLVPGAVAVALISLVASGGFARIADLGQAVSGPAASTLPRADSGAATGPRAPLRRLLASAGTAASPTHARRRGAARPGAGRRCQPAVARKPDRARLTRFRGFYGVHRRLGHDRRRGRLWLHRFHRLHRLHRRRRVSRRQRRDGRRASHPAAAHGARHGGGSGHCSDGSGAGARGDGRHKHADGGRGNR